MDSWPFPEATLTECFPVVGRVTEVVGGKGKRSILLLVMIHELQCEVDSK